MGKMSFLYSSNDAFAQHTYISISSLLDTQPQEFNLEIYIIDDAISSRNKARIKELEQSRCKIVFVPFEDYSERIKGAALWGGALSTYGRLFAGSFVDSDIVVYLDADSIIVGDLSNLFSLDMSDCYVAGVQDVACEQFRTAVGLEKDDRYINAGFLVINLNLWRKKELEIRFLEFMKSFNGNVPCCDQGVINGVCNDHIMILPPKFNATTVFFQTRAADIAAIYSIPNYYTDQECEEAARSPVFVHFTGGYYIRPWYKNGDHPYTQIYREYLNKSPWKGNVLPNAKRGLKTSAIMTAYRILPFPLFLLLRRIARRINRAI